MISFETELLDIILRIRNVKSFRFRMKKNGYFKPGQYLFVTLKIKDTERIKPFSFSNSPTEKGYIEFTKRITESDFSKALDRLTIGDRVKVEMPFGSFTFEGEYEKIALLSGGIGITPVRSICKYSTDITLPTDIILLYGNNKEEDIIFRQELDQMCSVNKNMRVVYTIALPDVVRKIWQGRIGFIDDKMIREEIPDYIERVFYICGPPEMVENLGDILKNKLGMSEDRIKIEKFEGY